MAQLSPGTVATGSWLLKEDVDGTRWGFSGVLFIERGEGLPPLPLSFSQTLTHTQTGQPKGQQPASLHTTRVPLGKQLPFPLTRGCSMGGWLPPDTRVHIRLTDSASTPKQTKRCERSNYPHCLEEEVS